MLVKVSGRLLEGEGYSIGAREQLAAGDG